MASQSSDSPEDLLRHLLVPVADAEDAKATAQALAPYEPSQITVTHVVEKGEGVPDKTPVEQSESVADEAFATFQETFPEANEEVTYRRDVITAIIELADELDVSAVAFCPRGGNRLIQFLAGDKALRLITESDRPVLTLPKGDGG